MLICTKSEVAANRVMASVTKWLKDKLRVEVNATKTKVAIPNKMFVKAGLLSFVTMN